MDNALAITTDGRKLALDARLLSATAEDHPGTKINALAENVERIWRNTAATRGTQMIFCDMGVNPTPWGYGVYDEVIEKLTARGIPREQIAAVGDADSDAKKQSLFDRVRSGAVRVLLGSTAKMGTGTNVQKRLAALHHLDAPWKPAEVEQREGRILRQGNSNEQVAIYRYVTEGSFDAYMWQALETKARFIGQVMTGESAARRAEDIGGQELSYAEVKAIASGNPAVLTLAEADAELQRLAILKKNHADEQYLARRALRELPGTIERLDKRLASLAADMATAQADGRIMVGEQVYPHDDALAVLGKRLKQLPAEVSQIRTVPLGTIPGTGVRRDPAQLRRAGGVSRRRGRPAREPVPRRRAASGDERPGPDHRGLSGPMRESPPGPGNRRRPAPRLRRPPRPILRHDAYLAELTGLRDRLKAGLAEPVPAKAGTTPEAGTPSVPNSPSGSSP